MLSEMRAGDLPAATRGARNAATPALVLAALGVVFGDIGTSPLYALQAVFSIDHAAVEPSRDNVFGIISMVFWTVLVIVSIKYVALVMRADNDGEGGVVALAALARQRLKPFPRWRRVVLLLGIVGAALFYGDSLITPAISVLSAVEGLQVSAPSISSYAPILTVIVITLLFLMQPSGTARVGRLFGPVMVLWFGSLALLGIPHIIAEPRILLALSPTYVVTFSVSHPGVAFVAMGAVVLSVTGAEALYADLGHFGRPAIRRSWFFIVFPCLVLNYLGQGALILDDGSAVANPFFHLAPSMLVWPLVILATAATVIASQSVISGSFSMTRQAMRFGIMPRLTVKHTSERHIGQIYVGAVNWMLMAGVLTLVLVFRTSSRLSAAYGLAVTGTFVLTTVLLLTVAKTRWGWSKPRLVLVGVLLGGVELTYWSANLTKFLSGGWIPLTIAALLIVVMVTWQRGRDALTARRTEVEGPMEEFLTALPHSDSTRVPGTAIFLHATPQTAPLALRDNVLFNHVLHERTVIVSLTSIGVPYADPERLLDIDDRHAASGVTLVAVRQGFMDRDGVPELMGRIASELELEKEELLEATYFLSNMVVVPGGRTMLPRWQKRLFIGLIHNSATPVGYFGLPVERVVVMGSQIEL